jgi:hydroxymethylbilane synthase
VETRLRKLDQGEYDAVVLAEAGLIRLGLKNRISVRLEPPAMYPAVSQGALGLECRRDDRRTQDALSTIDHAATHACVNAERTLLRELRAGCHAPLGAFSRIDGGALWLSTVVLDLEGRARVEAEMEGSLEDPETLGCELAKRLREKGAAALLGEEGD